MKQEAAILIEIRALGISIRILRSPAQPPRKPSILTHGVTSEQGPGLTRTTAPAHSFRKSA